MDSNLIGLLLIEAVRAFVQLLMVILAYLLGSSRRGR